MARKGATAEALGQHLGCTRQYVSRLADEGVLPRLPDSTFDLDVCRLAYIGHLKDGRRAKAQADGRVRDARAREIELRIAEKERRLCDVDEATSFIDSVIGPLKSDLLGLPSRLARDAALRQRLEHEIDDVLRRAADRAAARERELRAGP